MSYLMQLSLPNTWSLRLPRQKCSAIWNISTGLSRLPWSGSSSMIRSMSTLAWIKSPSVDLLTVPLIPMRQCSLVRQNTALGSVIDLSLFLALVLIQQMSSHRLNPQFWRHNLPRSSPSLLPHHRNTKLLQIQHCHWSRLLSRDTNTVFWLAVTLLTC